MGATMNEISSVRQLRRLTRLVRASMERKTVVKPTTTTRNFDEVPKGETFFSCVANV